MKKLFTIVALVVATMSFAQMKVTDVEDKSEVVGQVGPFGMPYTAKVVKQDGLCILRYKDANYQQIDEYKAFGFRESDLDAMYGLFSDVDGVEDGDTKKVELEDGGSLTITYKKTLGKIYPYITHTHNGVTGALPFLNHKQIAKLFGKKKK